MIRIIHLTDIHFAKPVLNPLRLCNKRFLGNLNFLLRRRKHFRLDLADSLLEALASMSPDAVLVGGDLTTTATEQEFEMAGRFVERLREIAPFVCCVPGNHDVYTFESVRKHRYQKHLGHVSPADNLPKLYTLPGGTPLLALPTVRPNLLSSRGEITEEHLAAIRESLYQPGAPRLWVLAHYPLLYKTEAYYSAPSHRLCRADELRDLLGQSNRPVVYLCGHIHRFSYVRDPEYPNIGHVTTAALFYRGRGRYGGFTEILVDGEMMTITPWTFAGSWTQTTPMVLPSH